MFKVSSTGLQTFIDMPNCVLEHRVQYGMVHILNVFCDGHLQVINCVGTVQIHRVFHHTSEKKSGAQRFLITLCIKKQQTQHTVDTEHPKTAT
jgi:hypothetical protein